MEMGFSERSHDRLIGALPPLVSAFCRSRSLPAEVIEKF